MHLREVLELVDRPLSQEQAWAILYQCSSLLKRIWRQRQRDGQPIFPVELEFVCLAGDGSIDVQWQGKKGSNPRSSPCLPRPLHLVSVFLASRKRISCRNEAE
jgi:hypothetical protein